MNEPRDTPNVELVTDGIHHLAVLVVDLPRAITFYEGTLGLPILRRWPSKDGCTERSVWFQLATETFLAVERYEPENATTTASADSPRPCATSQPGFHLIALTIRSEDRARWREHLRAKGHAVTHETPYTLYSADPEGNRIALSHWPTPAVDDVAPVDA